MDSFSAWVYLISIPVICPNVGCLNLKTNFSDKRRKYLYLSCNNEASVCELQGEKVSSKIIVTAVEPSVRTIEFI